MEAADKAARRAQKESVTRQLLVLLPTLEQTGQALDAAVSAGEHAVARRELAIWRLRASELKGLLSERKDAPETLRAGLDKSITQAAAAKNRLFDEETDLIETSERARRQLDETLQQISEFAGKLKGYPEEQETANG